MPKKKLVKERDYNYNLKNRKKQQQQIVTYDIDKLKVGAVSYNLEGARFTKINDFFKKLVFDSNLNTSRIDILIVGLQEVKNTIKTRELNKISGLSKFPYITILGDRGILRGATRLIIFSKYKLKIEPAINNIKNTFKTIKNIIIANIQLPVVDKSKTRQQSAKKSKKGKKEGDKENLSQSAIQFSVLNCHLPKASLKKYITDDKLSQLKFKNNIILGDFNSRTEFIDSRGRGKGKNKTRKVLTDNDKYDRKYDTILKELEGKTLKDLLSPSNENKDQPEFTDTLHQYKQTKEKLKEYRELKNKSGTKSSDTKDLPQNPTYKINPKTGKYVYYKKEKRTRKLRVPSYADRILVTGNDILIEKYSTLSSIKLSDHLPIMGIYNVKKDTYKYTTDTTVGKFIDYEGIPLAGNNAGFTDQSPIPGDKEDKAGVVSVTNNVGLVSGTNPVDLVSSADEEVPYAITPNTTNNSSNNNNETSEGNVKPTANEKPIYDLAKQETKPNEPPIYDYAAPGTNSSREYKNVSHGTEMINKEIQTSLREEKEKEQLIKDNVVGTKLPGNSQQSLKRKSSPTRKTNYKKFQLTTNPMNTVPVDNQEIKFIKPKVEQNSKPKPKPETELEKALRLRREKIEGVLDALKTLGRKNKNDNEWLEKIRNKTIEKEELEKAEQALILTLRQEIRQLIEKRLLLNLQNPKDKYIIKQIKDLDTEKTEKEELLAELLKKYPQKGGSKKLKINKKRRKISRRTKKAQK
jgi:hypothetical protein